MTMKTIPLTRGKVASVSDSCYECINQHKWTAHPGYKGNWYAVRSIWDGKRYHQILMHREIMNAPDGLQVDHINGDGLDNRRENLRLATRSENEHNRRKLSKTLSQYKGVTRYKSNGKWLAQIIFEMQHINIGIFDTELEAAKAYNEAAKQYHGEFARLNQV